MSQNIFLTFFNDRKFTASEIWILADEENPNDVLEEIEIKKFLQKMEILHPEDDLCFTEIFKNEINLSTDNLPFDIATINPNLWNMKSMNGLWQDIKKESDKNKKLTRKVCSLSYFVIESYLKVKILDFIQSKFPTLYRPKQFNAYVHKILNDFTGKRYKLLQYLNKQYLRNDSNLKRQERPLDRKELKDKAANGNPDAIHELKFKRSQEASRKRKSPLIATEAQVPLPDSTKQSTRTVDRKKQMNKLHEEAMNGCRKAIEKLRGLKVSQKILNDRKKERKNKLNIDSSIGI